MDLDELQVKWNKALTLILILQLLDRINLCVSKTKCYLRVSVSFSFLLLLKKQMEGEKREALIFIISTCVRLCVHLFVCLCVCHQLN